LEELILGEVTKKPLFWAIELDIDTDGAANLSGMKKK